MAAKDVKRIREALLAAFEAAVSVVEGDNVTANWLRSHPQSAPMAVIALGKAAAAMAYGAQQVLGDNCHSGLVVTKTGHAGGYALDPAIFRVCEGAHPMPDESSLAGGEVLVDYVAGLPQDLPVLVLISGGASAIVEVLRPGVTLGDLARVNRWLLGNGLPIAQVNAVRRRLSQLKGGGLAELLAGHPVTGLLISDVEGDDPAVIGSGPLVPPETYDLPPGLPDWMTKLLPSAGDPPAGDGARPDVEVIATLDHALAAAERVLRGRGLSVERYADHVDGDIEDVARHIAQAVQAVPDTVHLWGGEVTVMLPDRPGRGGRNQQLALHLAQAVAGDIPAVALCAGTDGTDGPTEDAGGLVDNQTVSRGRTDELSVADCLRRADAGTFLENTGDLICTGPTGTNVTDLVMIWRAGTGAA
ncbi:glycerate kinase type-2 family protein [Thiosocius teredinicola]|uniref:glycerate kinase type-2 family protein n=1 Tax=Thiosocius teredinicola TaxID=1973002 RepID=UPI000990BFE4